MRIAATPRIAAEGRQLASELLGIVSRETRAGAETRSESRQAAGEDAAGEDTGDGGASGANPPEDVGNGHAPPAPRPAPPASKPSSPER